MTTTDQPTAHDTLSTLLTERHSCRAFLPDPVHRATIDQILRLAQRAPSWCNTQPWRIIVTEGEETNALRDELRAFATQQTSPDIAFPDRYVGAAQERRRTCASQLYDAVGITWGDREASSRETLKNFDLFGAPHLAIVTTDAHLGTYGAVDCGLLLQTFMLAATSVGVATITQAAIATCAPLLRKRYDLPDDRNVLCGISFGYEDTQHPANAFRTDRAPLTDVVTYTPTRGPVYETTVRPAHLWPTGCSCFDGCGSGGPAGGSRAPSRS
jgi:nitroreductase